MRTPIDPFVSLADPTRREILTLLRGRSLTAGELVDAFPHSSQPGISRHLKVLREAGLVEVERDEQRRIYSLRGEGFSALETWISTFRAYWPQQLDSLARHLDAQAAAPLSASPKKKS